ncbi:dihydropteroate synthase [Adhaeribacter arboris]|uniref:Dihydropteroate synthase n=1 Tax=Adhaeribacter arboris TaxID=2072846 RepID=A0A2T2YL05_9BACT|nr:dihydropteroate synthase [Adhaeribacter arboris]PSR56188.1 dihydropteroate synthase [Adhaeribacter arboris]
MKAKDTFFYKKSTLNCHGKILSLATPVVMGILNVTPDSFYEGSRLISLDQVVAKAEKMLAEGADILDIGGYSSRPGAEDISVTEEMDRVIPAIEAIRKALPGTLISIDTFRSQVAEAAVKAGASIINDISGGSLDEAMFAKAAALKAPYILMHMRGTPQTMKQLTNYDNLLLELVTYFEQKVAQLRAAGVVDIIIDPGFGFAKTIEQNFMLLRNLHEFSLFELPVLAGLSRKSMTYKTLGIEATEALPGTIALNTLALLQGASILRVHDVKEAVQTIKLVSRLQVAG